MSCLLLLSVGLNLAGMARRTRCIKLTGGTAAANVSVSSHRTAVIDRMYSDSLAVDYISSLQLLDPDVRPSLTCTGPIVAHVLYCEPRSCIG